MSNTEFNYNASNHPAFYEWFDLHREVRGYKPRGFMWESEEQFLGSLSKLREEASQLPPLEPWVEEPSTPVVDDHDHDTEREWWLDMEAMESRLEMGLKP